MCHHTPVLLRFTSTACRDPGKDYKLTTAIDTSGHRSRPSTEDQDAWPCSQCKNLDQLSCEEWADVRPRSQILRVGDSNQPLSGQAVLPQASSVKGVIRHAMPVEHFVSKERQIVMQKGLCNDCACHCQQQQRQKDEEGLAGSYRAVDEILKFPDRCILYAEQAGLSSGGQQRSRTLGSVLESTRAEYGYDPHAFAVAIVYAASRLDAAASYAIAGKQQQRHGTSSISALETNPHTKSELSKLFHVNQALLDRSYEKVFDSRRRLFHVVMSQTEREALPKPCCGRSQKQRCPVEWTPWNSEIVVCTAKQVCHNIVQGRSSRPH